MADPTGISDDSVSPQTHDPSESPPSGPGRVRREGNESLWKRARRTLGTNSLTFLQPQSRPPDDAATSSTAPGTTPANKRREQVRHAQRTHRQRTQNYIKTLESEVVRLREAETTLIGERDKLLSEVETLKDSLASANLAFPSGIEPTKPNTLLQNQLSTDFNSMPAIVSYSTDNLDHQRLHVQWPSQSSPHGHAAFQDLMQGYGQGDGFGTSRGAPYDLSLHPLSLSADTSNPVHLHSTTNPYAVPLDVKPPTTVNTLEIAIDFVLALEHPCMAHIPYPATGAPEDPVNHVMMVSTPLFARAPESPKPNTTWQTSGAIIKELLNLSNSINLDGEITPVEAWHRLHQHPDFWRLDRSGIERLKKELSGSVRCCGFGAVLDEDIFITAVNNLLVAAASRTRVR